ncbi:cell division protein FtsQ [Siminovitchia sp. FSL H7-0308]|uniref:cell division protein FtsQ n=1 Tax=Siminovitchia sp. FSL H7-0308 TaxID=2921432 RepID=UPI0030EE1AA6
MGINEERKLTQSQKMMIFVLSMSLFGLSKMITELLPANEIGPIEFSISYFAFIPLVLAALFHPLYVAVGASVGNIVFAGLLMGDFGGIGEVEGFIEFTLAIYVAGLLVRNPLSKRQLAVASLVGVGIDQLLSSIVDIGKVWFGVEGFDAVPGLPESIVILEGVSFLNEMVITGVLFGLVPTLYLTPKLYGKIEPLLGMKPREARVKASIGSYISLRLIIAAVMLTFVGMIAEFIAELDMNLAFWSSNFIEQFDESQKWIGYSAWAILAGLAIYIIYRIIRKSKKMPSNIDQKTA